ncbi:MAG: hypothetical protein ACAI43_18740, partial [Phycisphaerae bacterium]
MPPSADHLWAQIVWLFILAIPVACVAWTVTHEEVFREPREYCKRCSQDCRTIVARKFFYLFTCEYCFSHYVTGAFLLLTRYRLLMDDWRGYILSFFGLVFVANMYMSLYSRLRVDIRSEKAAANVKEHESELKRLEAITKEQETRMHSSRAGNGAHGVYEMTKDEARSS